MRIADWKGIALVLAAVAAGALFGGCGKSDVRSEGIATANGDTITIRELREYLGIPVGATAASEVPVEKKKEALDRLISGRLLAQDARARGLDNTQEFLKAVKDNQRGVWVNTLFRRELDAKMKVSDKEVKAEADKIKGENKGMSDNDASARAVRSITERQIRQVENELIAAAKKDVASSVDSQMVERVARGESVPDNAVLATAGTDRILYGELKRVLEGMAAGGPHGQAGAARNPALIQGALDREMGGRLLYEYAKKQKVDETKWYKVVRDDMERSALINLLADLVVLKDVTVSDAEVRAAYDEHAQMLIRNGKKIPLAEVREQLQRYILNQKKGKALEGYIAEQKKKAAIKVNDALLPKV